MARDVDQGSPALREGVRCAGCGDVTGVYEPITFLLEASAPLLVARRR
jgi:hypothetical protein